MADPTRTNAATGSSSVSTTTASFGFTATAGRLLVLVVGGDDYKTADPSGYTLSAGCAQETYLGHYVWWKIAAGGETSVQYTLGSVAPSAWVVCEYDNIETTSSLDTSNGQQEINYAVSYTTPAVVPSTGARFAIASIGGSTGYNDFTGLGTWTNSYTEDGDSFNNSGATNDVIGIASKVITGDGSTSTSSGATYEGEQGHAKTGIILVFKVAAGSSSIAPGSRLSLLGVG